MNQEWLKAAVASDTDLCECVVEQLLNTDNTVEPIFDLPTDIPMDWSDSDNVQSVVDPQATVANVASSTDIAVECNDPL